MTVAAVPGGDGPAAVLEIEPVDVTPGQAAMASFSLTNRGTDATSWQLRVSGMDPTWVDVPATVGPVHPAVGPPAQIVVTLPLGHPSSTLVGAVVAIPTAAAAAAANGSVAAGGATPEPATSAPTWW